MLLNQITAKPTKKVVKEKITSALKELPDVHLTNKCWKNWVVRQTAGLALNMPVGGWWVPDSSIYFLQCSVGVKKMVGGRRRNTNLKTLISSVSALIDSVPRWWDDLTQKQPGTAAKILFLFHTILYKELNVFWLQSNYLKMKRVVWMGKTSICCCYAVKEKGKKEKKKKSKPSSFFKCLDYKMSLDLPEASSKSRALVSVPDSSLDATLSCIFQSYSTGSFFWSHRPRLLLPHCRSSAVFRLPQEVNKHLQTVWSTWHWEPAL